MNRLQKAARSLWVWVQSSAPPSISRLALPYLNDLKEATRLATNPFLKIVELSGRGESGPLSVAFVNATFARRDLEGILFRDEPLERTVGSIPFWNARQIASRPESDLIIVGGSRHLISRLPRSGAIILPESVAHVLDLTGDLPAVEARFHRSIRRELQTRRNGYSFAVSHDERDFDEFYRRMYLPTMQGRHGRLSRPMPRGEAHQYFERGYILQVKRDGAWVAATICQPKQDTIVSRITGVRNADPQLIADGVAYFAYYGEIQIAHERGYRAIDFMGTGPYLASGTLQHKRRWGTSIGVPAEMRRRIWIRIRRETPAVAQFLKDNPLIVLDGANRLHGMIAVADPRSVSDEVRAGWERRYAMPGLSSLIVRSVSSFVEPTRDDLILPIPTPLGHIRAQ